ncbi:DNA-directed RNA polymerases i ii and iii subunit rpabc3 [Anaeramoeba ignava]|uniref:DNA-directed RNA polymerases i ii and iii subunit rpabc3 n=1 Tax=Anaeramoeba ignava TaxID=1746090 RepID=A0A9Q0LRX5_ANAIG|nr:DNA-directed RNA polymerases i ii and iii subunit rpabc3 [Anaeramoeba ignava]
MLFDDTFELNDIEDKERKVFEKVTRIHCKSEICDVELTLDVNTDIYPVKLNDKFKIAIASTLSLDGEADQGVEIKLLYL